MWKWNVWLLLSVASVVAMASETVPCPARIPLNPARERAELFVAKARFVAIDDARVARVAEQLAEAKFPMAPPPWNFPPYPGADASFDKMFRLFLIADSINYLYFHGRQERQFFDGGALKGAGLLVDRLVRHWDFFGDPARLRAVTEADLRDSFFAAQVPLPALRERARGLQEVGEFLHRRQGTDWLAWLGNFGSPMELVTYLSTQLEAFRDPFLKRSQLFVGMLLGRYASAPEFPAALRDPEGLTVYADYILPMVLRRMGILRYESRLAGMVDERRLLVAGSQEEEEIRAATIVASDRLRAALRRQPFYAQLNILGLDAALWLQAEEIPIFDWQRMPPAVYVLPALPHHRTLTTNY